MATVLVVEDDPLIRTLLTRILELQQYQVILAEDGVQAVARAEAERPDLILMDMGLPILDGWEATRRIRLGAATYRPPIIALTAYVMTADQKRAMQLGCDAFEPKPINFARLLPTIARLLAR